MLSSTYNFGLPADELSIMKDAGLVATSGAATVSSVARVFDCAANGAGGSTPPTRGMSQAPVLNATMDVNITAIEVASGDELYTVILEGCNTADFSTGSPQIEPLAMMAVGAGAVIPGAGSTSTPIGRMTLHFTNEKQGTTYRYLRVFTVVAGTIASGINYTARLSPDNLR